MYAFSVLLFLLWLNIEWFYPYSPELLHCLWGNPGKYGVGIRSHEFVKKYDFHFADSGYFHNNFLRWYLYVLSLPFTTNFLTWLLVGLWLCCQPIADHFREFLLANIAGKKIVLRTLNPGRSMGCSLEALYRTALHTVYPKKYAHGFCFAVLCCGYTLTDFPISIRLTSLALWQSNDCPSASKATLMNMDKYFMWIHYERLHNHNKAKHNKTVCIFLGIYCTTVC